MISAQAEGLLQRVTAVMTMSETQQRQAHSSVLPCQTLLNDNKFTRDNGFAGRNLHSGASTLDRPGQGEHKSFYSHLNY